MIELFEREPLVYPDGREIMPIAGGDFVLPRFQAQNPTYSKYELGWASCQSFSHAMAAAFDRQVKFVMSGGQLRERVRPIDHVGGLTHAQVDQALNDGWDIDVGTYYRLPWATAEKFVDAGMGMSLSVWYAVLADSPYDAGRGFRLNHEIFVPPGWGVMDPLADGRYGEAYKYRGAAYPRGLLKEAAGKLNLSASGYRKLGDGLVYATFTRDRVKSRRLIFDAREAFWIYRVDRRTGHVTPGVTGRYAKKFASQTSAACTPPQTYAWDTTPGRPGGIVKKSLVQITTGTVLKGAYIAYPQAALHLEVAA